jgi:exosortase
MIRVDRRLACLTLLLAVSVLLGWRSLAGTFLLSWYNVDYTHILIVLPLSLALILLDQKELLAARKWNFGVGSIILASAAAIAICTRFWSASLPGDEALSLGTFALVLSWIGISVACFGLKSCGRALFPLLFLFALVPLPKLALDAVIAFLQQGSAWSTHVLYAIAGVPVIQQGDQLTIPGLIVRVAQECSSIRSSSMLAITTVVMAHLLLRSPWRKVFILLLVIPLSVAKNGLRIFTITILGTTVDPGYLTGRLHRQGGILFFLVALVVIFAILQWLRRGEKSARLLQPQTLRETVASH